MICGVCMCVMRDLLLTNIYSTIVFACVCALISALSRLALR